MRLRLFSRKKFFFHAPDKDSRQRLLFIKWMNAQDFFIKIISIVNSYTWHEFIGWLEGTIRRPIPKRNFNDHVVFFISLPFFLSFFLFFFFYHRSNRGHIWCIHRATRRDFLQYIHFRIPNVARFHLGILCGQWCIKWMLLRVFCSVVRLLVRSCCGSRSYISRSLNIHMRAETFWYVTICRAWKMKGGKKFFYRWMNVVKSIGLATK